MPDIKSPRERVAYVTPGVFVDAGGWEIIMVNGKLVVKRIPPWDGDPIVWSSILIAAGLQRLAAITEKPKLEPQLVLVANAILSEYSTEIKNMIHKINPHIDLSRVPKLGYVYLKLFGCDGGGIGILAGGQIVKIPGWTPELLVPLVGSLEHLAEVTEKNALKTQLKTLAKSITEAYIPELTQLAGQEQMAEFAHA